MRADLNASTGQVTAHITKELNELRKESATTTSEIKELKISCPRWTTKGKGISILIRVGVKVRGETADR